MNRTIKEATVKRYHYDSHDQLRGHIGDFVSAYNQIPEVNTQAQDSLNQSQKMTVAAMHMLEKKVCAQRS